MRPSLAGSVSLIRAAALQLISLPLVLALIALRCVDGLAAIGASRYLRDAVLVRWRPAPLVRFAAEIDDLVLPSPAPVLLCGSLVLSVSYGVCRPLSGVIVCAPFASSRRTLQARLFHCSVTASELFRLSLCAKKVLADGAGSLGRRSSLRHSRERGQASDLLQRRARRLAYVLPLAVAC